MEWPGVVTFRFDDSGRIEAFPEPGVRDEWVIDLCRRSVEPIIRQALGWETIHASAVRFPSGVVAFCGDRGTGKSTLAYSLSRRGFAQYADDTVVLDVCTEGVRALDLPYGVRLREETALFYGFEVHKGRALHDVVALTRSGDELSTSPMAALVILGRKPAGPPDFSRLPSSAAFPVILAHAHTFSPNDPAGRRRTLEHYLTIAATVPTFTLTFSAGLDRLDQVLDAVVGGVEADTGNPCPSPR